LEPAPPDSPTLAVVDHSDTAARKRWQTVPVRRTASGAAYVEFRCARYMLRHGGFQRAAPQLVGSPLAELSGTDGLASTRQRALLEIVGPNVIPYAPDGQKAVLAEPQITAGSDGSSATRRPRRRFRCVDHTGMRSSRSARCSRPSSRRPSTCTSSSCTWCGSGSRASSWSEFAVLAVPRLRWPPRGSSDTASEGVGCPQPGSPMSLRLNIIQV